MPDPEIRTFMIADVRGYTSFTQSHGDEAAAQLAATFAEIAREGAFPPILFKKDSVHQVVLDPSGGLAAVGLGDTQGNERISLDALAFASDGSLLSGGWSGLVQRWSIPSLQPIGQPVLTGGGPVGSVVAVPNSSLFATTNFDGSTKLWDLNSCQEIGSSFTPLVARWLGAAISPDGGTLAILAMDGNAWVFPPLRAGLGPARV
jgi:WD40 repeat protein